MKKILLFIICFFGMIGGINAADTIKVQKTETGIYSTKTSAGGQTFTAQLYYLNIGEKLAYCIEPGVLLQDQNYTDSPNFNDLGITEEVKKRIELIAHYGYEYPGHNLIQYYMAAQELIWEELGATNVSFIFNGYDSDVSLFKTEILRLIDSHEQLPSFAGKDYAIKVDETLRLTDINKVLDRFELVKGEGTIKQNEFIINGKEEGSKEYSFKQKKMTGMSLVYFSPNSQKVATFTLSDNNTKAFIIKVNLYKERGSIIVQKIDRVTKQPLENAEFELYDMNNQLVVKGKTSKEGVLIFEKLLYGKYTIKEISAPKGYILEEKPQNIDLNALESKIEVSNQKYEMPVTSNTDYLYYSSSLFFIIIGMGALYVFKKVS